ncbi:hypothetical protein ACFQ0K_01765 [Nocardioides caeni]|uniref:ATP synthase protein I n=1 Tax=Nocardioides caeni TaxID=574700 RepID=A0A4S8NPR4_9ACTN|nr:hypothetical protein [Nocardioides caeni]THV18421.1 hypothetical protein E9934_01990 [Nocardioides caeni]
MMTTADRTPSVVARAAAAAAAAAVLLVGIGALVGGADAVRGAAVGGVIAVGVFAFGAFSVDTVSRLMPAASLMFAMLTYTLQVVLMLMAFVVLTRSGLLDDQIDRDWLAGAIILGAMVWMLVQVRLATTARIPAFEPASPRASGEVLEPTVRTTAEGGAR